MLFDIAAGEHMIRLLHAMFAGIEPNSVFSLRAWWCATLSQQGKIVKFPI